MPISGSVSIPSAVGSSTVLTVSGQQALAFAQLLEHYLNDAVTAGSLNLSLGVQTGTMTTFSPPVSGLINEAVVSPDEDSGAGIGTTAFVNAGYQAVFDNVNGPTTVVTSATGTGTDAIIGGSGSSATFFDNGGNNGILFVNGNNLYVGETVASVSSDTIYGGTGLDTIYTGYDHADIYAGVGRTLINTNDEAPVSFSNLNADFNDYVYLADGQSTVNADGLKDAVIASAPDQLINAAMSSSDYTDVVLLPVSAPSDGDTINAHAGLTAVFDFASGNEIHGGAGLLLFMGGTDVSSSVFGGSGSADLFGAAGDTINWAAGSESQSNIFVAGEGNETLNAAGSQGNLAIFGYNGSDAAAASQISESLVGGAGNDTLVSGAGYETLIGGAGNNVFLINAQDIGAGAHITLNDFNASSNNIITFSGYSQDQINAALNGANTVTGIGGETNIVFTLSDNTTVTVVGMHSLVGHTFNG